MMSEREQLLCCTILQNVEQDDDIEREELLCGTMLQNIEQDYIHRTRTVTVLNNVAKC